MAQDIALMGAVYLDTPSVRLPKNGGGYATFTDTSDTTAEAADVAQGKSFYNANGEQTMGTGSYVTTDTDQDVTGAKTFKNVVKIQNGQGTGSLWIGGNVNANTLSNNQRHLARIVVPSYSDITVGATLLGFDTSGDSDLHVANKGTDCVAFGGMKKITNATSPLCIAFCVATERGATAAAKKVYPLELDSSAARFNVQPNYNGVNLATVNDLPTGLPSVSSSDNGKVLRVVSGAWAAVELPSASGVSF